MGKLTNYQWLQFVTLLTVVTFAAVPAVAQETSSSEPPALKDNGPEELVAHDLLLHGLHELVFGEQLFLDEQLSELTGLFHHPDR